LITGDVVVSPYPYGTDSYPGEWIEVLRKLKAYDFRVLIPGHGEVEHDSAYIDRLIQFIEDIRAQVGPLARNGMTLDEVRKHVDFSRDESLFAGQSDWIRFFMKRFFTDSMIANAYKEALGKPIEQGS
jgi:glyoxylase-like metal-dependent hydrolase (beta-lactamase superfamily II)